MDISNLTTAEKWDYIYGALGISDFMNFWTSSDLQNSLLPIKILFIIFIILFLYFVIYFYVKSSYIRYHYMQNLSELVSGQAQGSSQLNSRLKDLIDKAESINEKDLKYTIIQADDLLQDILKQRGYKGDDFNELINQAEGSVLENKDEIIRDHEIRNEIVYNLDYKLNVQEAKKILIDYDNAIRNLSI
ncbi:MAG: hypothetical protein A2639_00790 [Candidatus Staskawiczbacteria bacterium RIFCSPHIGHO2_01_FULL_34_27]|uniref:Uncharacterized protein n=2 Tax=Candidatus Staskawicziibacteriota TaxID=1817916 RepID=A0A1G2HJE0_9BACT|nr:MAG: hypothetical protein A2639_00790 [Candidatus Staskawiczbacteria bacterium RIFCSPHIGHO2_01_FULL_34_27]OGZ69025.1 MAG: hypothetical protein A3D35_02715 [Candidatus Staskawiczbacteria bacterium RIFCSPHIGHO2_02_FULL_34_9]